MSLVWSPGFNGVTDPDAQTYIAAVEAADGQAIEGNVAYAINDFVVGCKDDGIWDAIKASCILAGARTLSGALVPLKGTAPTNNNFVAADYNRETGLKGNGSNKYLDSNRSDNADPQNNRHLSVFKAAGTTTNGAFIGVINTSSPYNRATFIDYYSKWRFAIASGGATNSTIANTTQNFFGVSRSDSASIRHRINGASTTTADASIGVANLTYYVFNRNGLDYFTDDRLSFYSIGESLDLAKLDARVSTLMTDIGAAIP